MRHCPKIGAKGEKAMVPDPSNSLLSLPKTFWKETKGAALWLGERETKTFALDFMYTDQSLLCIAARFRILIVLSLVLYNEDNYVPAFGVGKPTSKSSANPNRFRFKKAWNILALHPDLWVSSQYNQLSKQLLICVNPQWVWSCLAGHRPGTVYEDHHEARVMLGKVCWVIPFLLIHYHLL